MQTKIPRWLLRSLLAVAALHGGAGVVASARQAARDREALVNQAAELGLRGRALVEVTAAIRREADRSEGRIALARTLFAVRDRSNLGTREMRLKRLAAAELLALDALRGQPASWEASSLLGSVRFESRQLRQDTRLFSAINEWERPLFAAVARAGGSPVVERVLAAAYVEVWPAMAPSRRDQASELLRRMFRDRRFFVQNFERWIEINSSFDRAAELLPNDSATASRMVELALRKGRAKEAVRYYEDLRSRLLTELDGGIRYTLGGQEPSRSNYLSSVLENAPLGTDFAPLVETAIPAAAPYGRGPWFAEAAARWLLWAEPLCLVNDCPLDPPTVSALLTSAAALVGTPSAAFAALASGKPAKAGQLARRATPAWSADWSSYLLLSAKLRLEAGDAAAARELLAQVHRSATRRPTYARLAQLAGAPAPRGASTAGDPLARDAWGPADWRRDAQSIEIEIGVDRAASAVSIALRGPTGQLFLLEAELDGRVGPVIWIAGNSPRIEVPLAIEPGIHLLRFRAFGSDLPAIETVRID